LTARRTLVLQPHFVELARVRRCVSGIAVRAGYPAERTYELVLAVSEATANAVEHAHGQGEVTVVIEVSLSALEVQVAGPTPFHLPIREGSEHRGLGLPLMVTLADQVRFSSCEHGTLVVLTFDRPDRSLVTEQAD
jgi:anti-sigma regulatory factor (Ser/Thr protein kinase)